jgi:hypothetical protein
MTLKGLLWLCVFSAAIAAPAVADQRPEPRTESDADAIYLKLIGITRTAHREIRRRVGTRPVVLSWDQLQQKYDISARTHTCPVYFGQPNARSVFTENGRFARATLGEIVAQLRTGDLTPDDLPIDFVWVNGKRVTANNRSLTALYMAGMRPTQMRDLTGGMSDSGDASLLVLQRLEGMGGKPSTEMLLRVDGVGADGEPKAASDWDAPIGEIVSMPEDLLREAQTCDSGQGNSEP